MDLLLSLINITKSLPNVIAAVATVPSAEGRMEWGERGRWKVGGGGRWGG